MKGRKLLILSFVFIIVFGIFIGVNYKSKIPHLVPNDENLKDFKISIAKLIYTGTINAAQKDQLDNSDSNVLQYTSLPYEDLYLNSDIIAIVQPTGERELKSDEILSEVIVNEVIKGEESIEIDQSIYIFEPFSINHIFLKKRASSFPNQDRISYMGVSNIMQSDREYIVFLKHFAYPDEYKRSSKEMMSFIFTDKYFGQFPFSLNKYLIIAEGQEHDYTYEDIMQYDSITENIESYNDYLRLQKEILNKLNLENHYDKYK